MIDIAFMVLVFVDTKKPWASDSPMSVGILNISVTVN